MTKIKESLFKSASETISENNLVEPGDTVLVCVSGGADSVALLHLLLQLHSRLDFTVGVAHVNHSLRGSESDRDSDFVKAVALKLDLPFHVQKQDVKAFQNRHQLSLEDAARQVRYSFFHHTAETQGYTKIATAHTANDNAELVLMNLFRGSGTSGLGGIPIKRGRIIRPLLNTHRESIIDYLNSSSLDYVSDSSNQSREFLRNRVRLDLLPHIQGDYNENIIECLNRTSRIIKDEEEWIDNLIIPLFKECIEKQQGNSIALSIEKLKKISRAPKRRVIRKAIESIKGDLKKITLFHTDLTADMADNRKPVLSADLPGQIQVKKRHNTLVFTRHNENLRNLSEEDISFIYTVDELKHHVTTVLLPAISMKMVFSLLNIDEATGYANADKTAWIDYNYIKFPLTIRNLESKDKFIPFGMSGSQTLKKFFSGVGVSGEDKKKCPLLISNNDIVWIGGHRIHNNYRVGPEPKNGLKVELLLD